MSKKGARSSGGGGSRRRAKDQAMAANLAPSPDRWRSRPAEWPYHNNMGTTHRRPGGKIQPPGHRRG
jgi:hypothetical protein